MQQVMNCDADIEKDLSKSWARLQKTRIEDDDHARHPKHHFTLEETGFL
jgi:hypothetical protein